MCGGERSGSTGRVNLAHSPWRKCVPRNLRAIYMRATRGLHRGGAARDDVGQIPLSRMFGSVHDVTYGVKPTSAPVSATAFLRPKSAEKCRLLLNATAINDYDAPPPPGHFLSVYFFPVSFCPCLPGPLGLDKLPPTPPPCP